MSLGSLLSKRFIQLSSSKIDGVHESNLDCQKSAASSEADPKDVQTTDVSKSSRHGSGIWTPEKLNLGQIVPLYERLGLPAQN